MERFLKVLKNYYIVFSICVVCVLVTGIIYGVKFYNGSKLKKTALAPPPVYVDSAPEVSKVETQVKKEEPVKENVKKEIQKDSVEEKAVDTMGRLEKNDFKIMLPVNSSEILKEYSGDELVYSDTFDDYRVHKGIDIKCKRSEAIFSVADGVVENVYTDSLEGIVIEINHNNGFKSIYKNLSSDKMVKKGEAVIKGQVISGVGETAIFESDDENHLHFELEYNSESVDPADFFE